MITPSKNLWGCVGSRRSGNCETQILYASALFRVLYHPHWYPSTSPTAAIQYSALSVHISALVSVAPDIQRKIPVILRGYVPCFSTSIPDMDSISHFDSVPHLCIQRSPTTSFLRMIGNLAFLPRHSFCLVNSISLVLGIHFSVGWKSRLARGFM